GLHAAVAPNRRARDRRQCPAALEAVEVHQFGRHDAALLRAAVSRRFAERAERCSRRRSPRSMISATKSNAASRVAGFTPTPHRRIAERGPQVGRTRQLMMTPAAQLGNLPLSIP